MIAALRLRQAITVTTFYASIMSKIAVQTASIGCERVSSRFGSGSPAAVYGSAETPRTAVTMPI